MFEKDIFQMCSQAVLPLNIYRISLNYPSALEAESNSDLQQQVEQLLCEVSPSNDTGHNSWVHCGRTKVFLTQSMVSFSRFTGSSTPSSDISHDSFIVPCLTAGLAGASEEEDPVAVRLHRPVLLAAASETEAPNTTEICYADPSR